MDTNLTSRPNLQHLKGQAKSLLNSLKNGDEAAARTLIEHLPFARSMAVPQVLAADWRLADAQSAIARQSGFAAWPDLARHVEQLRAMEGTWEFESLEVDGGPVPKAALAGSRILIDGDRFRMASAMVNYDGEFDIDVSATPHLIDIEFVEGPEAGNKSYGIFHLMGDRLTICLGLTGYARPAAFESKPGSGHALEKLVRAESARPPGVTGGTRPAQPALEKPTFTMMHEKLAGHWKAVRIVRDGMELPSMMLNVAKREASGTASTISFGGQVMMSCDTAIDAAFDPIHVDYHLRGPGQEGQVLLGIMKWEGDDVHFCYGGPDGARPEAFEAPAGSGRTLSVWRKS